MTKMTMKMFQIMWTAMYMPGHDEDMVGREDIRIDANALSAMNTWIGMR